jgi:6-phosphogluconate dehydrogenase
MQLGMIGLGRMGANIVRRVMRDGHTAVAYDTNADTVAQLVADGAEGASTLEEFVQKLETPRIAWVMIPAGITDKVVEQLGGLMDRGDIIINGGNSNYREDYDRAAALAQHGIEYMDVGTSGGVWGLERGYCLMIGGTDTAFAHCEPLFASIAPGLGDIERTAGRSGDPAPEEQGYLHCGGPGAGHFVKMVHNGIEYGIMAAYAEGLNVLAHANAGAMEQSH